jgi:hypothetical protein
MIHGNVKKTLDLSGVEIHGEHPVHSRRANNVGHQFCGDRHPRFGLAILAAVPESTASPP